MAKLTPRNLTILARLYLRDSSGPESITYHVALRSDKRILHRSTVYTPDSSRAISNPWRIKGKLRPPYSVSDFIHIYTTKGWILISSPDKETSHDT